MIRGCVPILLAAAGAAWALAPAPAQQGQGDGQAEASPPGRGLRGGTTAAATYRGRELRGFDVRVHPELLGDGAHAEVGTRALDALERDLAAVVDQVPGGAIGALRAVPVYLGVSDPVAPCACYHPSAGWLEQNGYDPAKAKAVEIANASTYLSWRRRQPSMVLHELAHAYHDQVHRGADGALARHLMAQRERGAYADVLRASGERDGHYAMTNGEEFFAETTEALLGVNDFYPFVRAELMEHDPDGARLVAELWGVDLGEAPEGEPSEAEEEAPPLVDLARADVLAVRALLERWYSGDADLAGLERFEASMGPDFVLVNRAGRVLPREEILTVLRAAGGEREIDVDTRVLRVDALGDDRALVVFQERQRERDDRRVLVTTALLERAPEAPGGVLWRHAHECLGAR